MVTTACRSDSSSWRGGAASRDKVFRASRDKVFRAASGGGMPYRPGHGLEREFAGPDKLGTGGQLGLVDRKEPAEQRALGWRPLRRGRGERQQQGEAHPSKKRSEWGARRDHNDRGRNGAGTEPCDRPRCQHRCSTMASVGGPGHEATGHGGHGAMGPRGEVCRRGAPIHSDRDREHGHSASARQSHHRRREKAHRERYARPSPPVPLATASPQSPWQRRPPVPQSPGQRRPPVPCTLAAASPVTQSPQSRCTLASGSP